jgi:hypothetical protein
VIAPEGVVGLVPGYMYCTAIDAQGEAAAPTVLARWARSLCGVIYEWWYTV